MAVSFRSTPQTTNAARLSRVIMGPCAELFRDVLRHFIHETNFQSELTRLKATVKPLLNGAQRGMLYPKSAVCMAKYVDFDISMLYLLIRNMCSITPHSKGWGFSPTSNDRSLSANLDRIREVRNKYCGHFPLISLKDSEFIPIWTELRQIIHEIELHISSPPNKFVNQIDFLRTETMDPGQESYYLDLMDKQEKAIDNLRAQQEKQMKRQEEQGRNLSRQGAKLQIFKAAVSRESQKIQDELKRQNCRLEQQGQSMRRQSKKLQTLESSFSSTTGKIQAEQNKQNQLHLEQRETSLMHSAKLTSHDNMLRDLCNDQESTNIIVNTDKTVKNHKSSTTYQETSVVKVAIERLRKYHIAIMTGKAGEGKTVASIQVMSLLSADYTPVIIHHPHQWHKVINSDKKMVVLLDDLIGKTNFDPVKLENWQAIFPSIFSSAQKGNTYVLIGIRQNILTKMRECSPNIRLFNEDFEINLTSTDHKLTMTERKSIINAYKIMHEIKENKAEKKEKIGYELHWWDIDEITKSDPYFGFPQTCYLFFTRKPFFELGPGFFKHSDQTLFRDIEKLRKSPCHLQQVGYCVLSYVFVYQHLDTRKLFTECDEFIEITKKVGIRNFTDLDIKDAAEELKGPYLSILNNENIFTFSHETVLEAVLLSFGQLSPDVVIQHCSKSMLYELIRTQNYKKRPEEIVLKIPKKNYPTLLDKLIKINTHKDGFFSEQNFLRHPATDDIEFDMVIFSSDIGLDRKTFCHFIQYEKPALIEAMLQHCQPDCCSVSTLSDGAYFYNYHYYYDSIYYTENENESKTDSSRGDAETETTYSSEGMSVPNSSKEVYKFVLTKRDLCLLLDWSIFRQYKKNVLVLCHYINTLTNAKYFYHRYICDPSDNIKRTILQLCLGRDMCDVVGLILQSQTVTQTELCCLLDKCIVHGKRNILSVICRYINGLGNVYDYYDRNIRDEDGDDTGLNALHHCVTHDWDDVVDVILTKHTSTKTGRNWSCAHLAAFFGRISLLKRFQNQNAGQYVTERTNEGYSVLQSLLLRLRYEIDTVADYFCFRKCFYLDVMETFNVYTTCKGTPSNDDYVALLHYLLASESYCIDDLYLPLDKYENNITHYLIVYNHEKMSNVLFQKCPDIFNHHNKTTLSTALHLAVYLGRYSMVRKLWDLNLSSSPNDKYLEGTCITDEYSLLHALMLGLRYETDQCTRYIDVDEINKLHPECRSSFEEDYTKTFNFILSKDSSLLKQVYLPLDRYGHNITFYIIIHNRDMFLDVLLQICPDIFRQRNNTTLPTPLHLAMYLGKYYTVKKLWNADVRPICGEDYLINKCFTTNKHSILHALMLGLRYGTHERAYLDIHIDVDGNTILHPKHIVSLYDTHNMDYNTTLQFILHKCPSIVGDLHLPLDKYGNNIIHYLVIHNREKTFDMLLQTHQEIFHHRNKTNLPSSLHVAVYLGRNNLVKKLLAAGVRPERDDISLIDTLGDGYCYCGVKVKYTKSDLTNNYQWTPLLSCSGLDIKLLMINDTYVEWGNKYNFDLTRKEINAVYKNR